MSVLTLRFRRPNLRPSVRVERLGRRRLHGRDFLVSCSTYSRHTHCHEQRPNQIRQCPSEWTTTHWSQSVSITGKSYLDGCRICRSQCFPFGNVLRQAVWSERKIAQSVVFPRPFSAKSKVNFRKDTSPRGLQSRNRPMFFIEIIFSIISRPPQRTSRHPGHATRRK